MARERDPGEGLSASASLTGFVEAAPHPDPLPAKSGARGVIARVGEVWLRCLTFESSNARTVVARRCRRHRRTAGRCCRSGSAHRDRQAREPHADRRLQGARRPRLCRPLGRERPHVAGLISATRGNHGQSLAFAASRHGLPVTILVPRGNSVEKNRAMRAFGATLIEHGDDFQDARARKPIAAPMRTGSRSCRRSIRTWCSVSRPMRSNCCKARPAST